MMRAAATEVDEATSVRWLQPVKNKCFVCLLNLYLMSFYEDLFLIDFLIKKTYTYIYIHTHLRVCTKTNTVLNKFIGPPDVEMTKHNYFFLKNEIC